MSLSSPALASLEPAGRTHIRRLMVFFAALYVIEGAGQNDNGLIAQPLNYYLKAVFGWTPVEISAYLTVLNLPWFIKPLYGAISDFIPLFGYRRKSYLILANAAAAIAYLSVAQVTEPSRLIGLLLLTAYGLAISSALCGAVLVESGRRTGSTGAFVNQQWLWYNVATIASAVAGGLLVEVFPATLALHAAALSVGVLSMSAIFATLLVREQPEPLSASRLATSLAGLATALRRHRLYVMSAFLFFYYFSPGFVTPLYFTLTDQLKFSQQYIGVLSAIQSLGWIAGGLLYRACLEHLSSRQLLNLSIAAGVATTLSFLFLSDGLTAALAEFSYGAGLMILLVATLTLAADHCPKGAEGFVFAALMSVTNLSGSLADNVGSYLFEHVFANRLPPLIVVSAAFTALAFFAVPLLKLGPESKRASALSSA